MRGRWRVRARPRAPWCSRRRQSAGRGRLGRAWASPAGGAYLSIVLRPTVTPAELAPLALVVGLGVARGLAGALRRGGILKWPNDVLLASGKLAGVLLEMSAETDRVNWVVAGRGAERTPERRRARSPAAACLDDVGPGRADRPAVAAVLDGIAGAYAQWSRDRASRRCGTEYEARSSLIGQRGDRARHDGCGEGGRNRDGCRPRGPAADRDARRHGVGGCRRGHASRSRARSWSA